MIQFLLIWYGAVSLIAFATYAWDKAAARRHAWRVRELVLHGLGLAGGWPGALLGQRWLRHKTRKTSFQWMFWFTVLLNVALLVWLLVGLV